MHATITCAEYWFACNSTSMQVHAHYLYVCMHACASGV